VSLINKISISIKDKNKKEERNSNGKIKEENNSKGKEKSDEKIKEKGDLVIALYDFNGTNSSELTFHKDDYLIVTN